MRYAILSDIHGNLEALRAVLEDIENQQVDKIVCLGDVVGYGPAPNECIQLIREKADVCLMGNHDYAAIGKEPIEFFNKYARQAIVWTRRRLTPDALAYLKERPFEYIEDDITFVHSSPYRPEEWIYIISARDALPHFNYLQTRICFVGHSHVAIGVAKDDRHFWTWVADGETLRADARYIINVGSVGQPRDSDPRACYGVYDAESGRFTFRRLEYDIEATQRRMAEFHLPPYLIDRLKVGR